MIDVVGIITARGGSKGIPGKHLLPLGGKPLIAWTIEAALMSRSLRRVVVSTDDPAIASASRSLGADVPFMRPAALATDDAPHVPVVLHALDFLDETGQTPAFCMLLQPTSPFRSSDDIDQAIELAAESGADAVISVSTPEQHPYKIFRVSAEGTLVRFIAAEAPDARRQDLPSALAENGAIYLIRCERLRRDRTFIPEGTRPYVMPAERSVDIDTLSDLRFAEWLAAEQAGARG